MSRGFLRIALIAEVMILSKAYLFRIPTAAAVCKFRPTTLKLSPLPNNVRHMLFSGTRLLSTVKADENTAKADESTLKASSPKSSPSIGDKAKELWNNYGYLAIGTYFGIYITTLGSIFTCLDNDLLNAAAFGLDPAIAVQKVCDIVEKISGYSTFPDYVRQYPQLGTLAIAWVMTKLTEPLRLVFTIFIVPKISTVFGYRSNQTPSNK